jgi:Ser/Thr protein kinase RdoA (MazF antagonist)
MIQTYGVRIGWADLPVPVRDRIEAVLGAPVSGAVSQTGGFSPGTADRVVTADGRRAFVKAVSTGINVRSVELARAEAHVTARMPPAAPVPRLLGSFDDGDWVVLIHEDVEGRHPQTPWVAEEIHAAVRALRKLAEAVTPAPPSALPRADDYLASHFGGWNRLAADPPDDLDPWVAARLDDLREAADRGLAAVATGATLSHCDIRADNLLVRPEGSVVIVDWPYGCIGPAWLDTALLAMDVLVHGGPGDDLLAGIDPPAATAVLAGFTGDHLERSRHPSPGIPHVRAFQRARADAMLPWLRRNLGGLWPDRQMGGPAHLRGVGNPGH